MADWNKAKVGDTLTPTWEGDADCDARDASDKGRFMCLRGQGHEGQHVATGTNGYVHHVWGDEKITYEQVAELVESWEAMDSDVDYFIRSWVDILNGDAETCPESDDKLHQVTDGPCELCGEGA